MAEKLTDEELVEELRSYGETASLPLKHGKRELLMKKLNHLRVKHQNDNRHTKKINKRAHLDVLSSDDSDLESAGHSDRRRSNIVSGVSKSLRRRSTANAPITAAPATKPEAKRTSLGRPSLRSRKSDVRETAKPTPKTSSRRSTPRLYPNLEDLNVPGPSLEDDNTFESSDSDLDGSTYEVENKSVNTTFTIESNRSVNDSRSPDYRKFNASYSNHIAPNSSQRTNLPKGQYTNHVSSKSPNDHAKKQYRLYPERVSGFLLLIVGGFFLVLAVCYLFVRRDVIVSWYTGYSSKPAQKNIYLLCSDKGQKDCYDERVVTETVTVIRDLYDILSSKKGAYVCGHAKEWEKHMSVDQFHTFVKNMKTYKVESSELVKSCLEHIMVNPHWNIRALDTAGEAATLVDDVKHLESAVASMGLMCRLQRSLYRVTGSIMLLVAVCVLVLMLIKYLKWRTEAKEKELKQVYSMVDEIIDILKRHHDYTQDESSGHAQYLAVQHVRDQLLPPSKRRELQPIWEKAVQFIEKNESRIRLEEQTIQGEEFRVWRWIHNSPNGGKVWQGQAFGEHDDNSNTAMICPTPCLKIRNMFDADVEGDESDWEVNIQDALLEKCKKVDSIYHIYVDKESKEGCVYMKCSSCEAAGRARQALHGWWFDRRLVTVRYLKLDYYHNRFSDSAGMNKPLLPSTNQMSSLSQPFYRSSLEMT